MAKKVKYQLGDIVKIPLKNEVYGFGRILLKQRTIIFIGFYDIVSNNAIDISLLKNKKYILKIECGDPGITRKEWEISGNIPLEEEITLPYFWDENGLTGELYIRKYTITEDNPLAVGASWVDKPATEEEIKEKDAQPDGLFGWKAAEIKLKLYLEKAGVLK